MLSGNKQILIAEGDRLTATMIRTALLRVGCGISVACSGHEAMELAILKRFDLVVLDARLPEMSSFEICEELKGRHLTRNTPIVVVADQFDLADLQRSYKAGADDYMAGPMGREIVSRLLIRIECQRQMNCFSNAQL